jgi:alanyl-tRNA synthetase
LSDLAQAAEVVTLEAGKVGIHIGEMPRELVPTLAGLIAEAVDGAGIVVAETQIAISSKTLDARGLFTHIQEEVGGKGGGSPRAANGRLSRSMTRDELIAILQK